MASQRLTFLYPHLFKPVSRASSPVQRRAFGGSPTYSQQHVGRERHGSAVEPPPPSTSSKPPAPKEGPALKQEARKSEESVLQTKGMAKKDAVTSKTSPRPSNPKSSAKTIEADSSQNTDSSAPERISENASAVTRESTTVTPSPKPLETVLHLPAPSSSEAQAHKPPHLQATPYVHHFDTYTLVRDLESGGFTADSAVTTMKAVRGILADNFALAKEGLVSKSDVENETYLFRAACSELRTEIQNNRKSEADHMRTARSQLQHEVEILNQKLTQELLTLKDGLKGMFDDRKMAVRTEQRSMDSSIQELNYKITVSLNSDMKSEVEGLRWVLTRRAAMAIVTMAFLILGSLRAASVHTHNEEMKARALSSSSSNSHSSSSPVSTRDTGTDAGLPLDSEGGSGGGGASYISLG